jgi:spermidine synthase
MAASLFVEQHTDGVAFYINGELQFHSADEAIYHEYLTIPAIALAAKRFPDELLRVLICGGGDGLAGRDILRFPQVCHIDLVDYSQEVIDLGKQDFASFNQGSLVNPKVTIHIHEAFAFLNRLVQEFCAESLQNYKYHAIICDFTYPTSVTETQVYALEWFDLLKQVLVPSGIIAANSVSPDCNTLAFWCIYQTMQAAGLAVKPMQLQIPSFINHDYGNWGFLLASENAIIRSEIESLDLPPNLRELSLDALQDMFIFDTAIAKARHSVTIHQKDSSQLLFYLLNHLHISNPNKSTTFSETSQINFLDLQDSLTVITNDNHHLLFSDPMSLESLAQSWLKQLDFNPDSLLIPAQHHSQTPEISQEWLGRSKQLLNQIDFPRLIAKLLERSQELTHEIADDLRELQTKIIKFQQSQSLEEKPEQHSQALSINSESRPSFNLTMAKVIVIVSLTLIVSNLAAPDAVFAKGSTSSSGFISSSDDGSFALGFLGFMMTVGGIVWLMDLADDKKN